MDNKMLKMFEGTLEYDYIKKYMNNKSLNLLEKRLDVKDIVEDISFTIPLPPLKKSRPRSRGGLIYDPDEKYKLHYRDVVNFLLKDIEVENEELGGTLIPEDAQIIMYCDYYMPIPNGISDIGALEMLSGIGKPSNVDIDNLDKFTFDVLQLTKLFNNDNNIIQTNSNKLYSLIPRISITIKYIYKRKE